MAEYIRDFDLEEPDYVDTITCDRCGTLTSLDVAIDLADSDKCVDCNHYDGN